MCFSQFDPNVPNEFSANLSVLFAFPHVLWIDLDEEFQSVQKIESLQKSKKTLFGSMVSFVCDHNKNPIGPKFLHDLLILGAGAILG